MKELIESNYVSISARLQVLLVASFLLVLAFVSAHPLVFHICRHVYLGGQGASCVDAYVSAVAVPLFIYATWAYAGVLFALAVSRRATLFVWRKLALISTPILLGFIFTIGLGPPPGTWIDLFPYYRLDAAQDAGIFFLSASIIYVVASHVKFYIKVLSIKSKRASIISDVLEIAAQVWAPLAAIAVIVFGIVSSFLDSVQLILLLVCYVVGLAVYVTGLTQVLRAIYSEVRHNASDGGMLAWQIAVATTAVLSLVAISPFLVPLFDPGGTAPLAPIFVILPAGYLAVYLLIVSVRRYQHGGPTHSKQDLGNFLLLLLTSLISLLIFLGLLVGAYFSAP